MKKAGILIATFLMIASMMTACGCTGTVDTVPDSSSTTTTAAPTTKTTAPTTAPTTVPPTTKTTAPTESSTKPTDDAVTTPGMRRKMPLSVG